MAKDKRPKLADAGRHKQHIKQTGQCSRCGREQHSWDKCPARHVIIAKKGHYSVKCRSKPAPTASGISTKQSYLDGAYLDMLRNPSGKLIEGKEVSWKWILELKSQPSPRRPIGKPNLDPPEYVPSGQPLHVLGQFKLRNVVLQRQGKYTASVCCQRFEK